MKQHSAPTVAMRTVRTARSTAAASPPVRAGLATPRPSRLRSIPVEVASAAVSPATVPEAARDVVACACSVVVKTIDAVNATISAIFPPTTPEPSADTPLALMVLGWVRRQVEQVLAIPPIRAVVQAVSTVGAQLYHQLSACAEAVQPPPVDFDRTTVVAGLSQPTDFRFLDDHLVVITEKTGAIKLYDMNTPTVPPTTLVVIPVSTAGERGVLGVEVDPDFSTAGGQLNGYLYVSYVTTDNLDRLSRIHVTDGVVDLSVDGTEKVLLQGTVAGASNHHGGEVRIGPDGMLYWALGENGNRDNADDLSNIQGKILRLNPEDGSAPAGNPFLDDPDAVPQIYAYGLRNPFRFTFTPDGQLLAADVGENTFEELNIIVAGGDYGWPGAEGVCTTCSTVNPIYTYAHSIGQSAAITSVLVYTGDTFGPDHQNKVFIADYTQGWIRELTFTADFSQFISERTFDADAGSTVKLMQGPDGNIYQLTISGELSRIAPKVTV